MSDEILFAEDTDDDVVTTSGKWKVLIVDDEPEVHAVTKLALGDFVFQDRDLEFISDYNGKEAKQMFLDHNDIAVVLLDVVMETDDAGLKVADFIRNEANNHFTRIILRTGQPGQAPERDVIINYDINDYKSKTELTAQKLFTVVISALRSYRDINSIEESRQGLEKIIAASADLFSILSLENFIEGIVQQLASLLGGTKGAVYLTSAVAGPKPIESYNSNELYVFTGKGAYEDKSGEKLEEVLSGDELLSCKKAYENQCLVYEDEYLVAYCGSKTQKGSLLYLSGLPRALNATDKRLVEIFSQNVQIAFDNVLLTKDMEDTQREVIERIGKAMEHHFGEGKHIQRMVKICDVLGREVGLTHAELNTLCLAVPLHDIGKAKVPESILIDDKNLNDEELNTLRNHAEFGYNLLKDSNRPLIKTAALIARDHHEYWNGNGYPRGKSGENIHIFCRITSLADAFDLLRNKRKENCALDKVLDLIKAQKGKQFDPQLVDILLANIDEIEQIVADYPDQD
jgi:response regulator RpfG family c-di-GMP phosphodiesterase